MRYRRTIRKITRSVETIEAYVVPWKMFHHEAHASQDKLENPVALTVSTYPDIRCVNDSGALSVPRKDGSRNAMLKEVESQVENKHSELIRQVELPAFSQLTAQGDTIKCHHPIVSHSHADQHRLRWLGAASGPNPGFYLWLSNRLTVSHQATGINSISNFS
jgi:hypothetical protein